MNRLIETLKNIWKITELRNRILFTIMILAIYRFGAYVVLPGVVPSALEAARAAKSDTDILGLLNIFTGGAFFQGAIFALGIMPYITSSIIIQLLGFAVPYFQRLQQKEGESGRKKINQITRFLTLLITLVQGGAYLAQLNAMEAVDPSVNPFIFWLGNIIILSTGTVFAMWMGEKVTDKGIGNGISLLIMVGIISRLPQAFFAEVIAQFNNNIVLLIIVLALFFGIVLATVLIIQAVRKIPVQFAKRMVGRVAGTSIPIAGARDYIPLKVNAAGVMPIIFAQAIMFLPVTAASWLSEDAVTGNSFLLAMNNWKSLPYNIVFFVLIVVFTYVYTALLVNPKQYAEYLKRQNSFIPGVKPGKPTQDFIDNLTTRITLPGSIFLGLISVFPAIVGSIGVNDAFALFFGGTSLLILVGVVLDTLQQIESHLLMRKYDGLVKSGKLKGRKTSGMQQLGGG